MRRTDQDVPFWLAAARQANGLVLELACGTGRITLPLAAAGVAIVGLDRDRAMLAAARQKAHEARMAHKSHEAHESHESHEAHEVDKATQASTSDGLRCGPTWPLFVAADMRRFALAARFGLIFIGYNSLQLLAGRADMAACLRQARQHLAPGGLVGIEVTDFQVGGADGPADDQEPDGEPLGAGEGVQLSGALEHDLTTRTSRYRRRFTGDGWVVENEVVVRSVDESELGAILTEAGLTPTRGWQHGPTLRAFAVPG